MKQYSYLLTGKITTDGSFVWKQMVHWNKNILILLLSIKLQTLFGTSNYVIKVKDFGGAQVILL